MTGVTVCGAWCIPLWMEYPGRTGLDWTGLEWNGMPCCSLLLLPAPLLSLVEAHLQPRDNYRGSFDRCGGSGGTSGRLE